MKSKNHQFEHYYFGPGNHCRGPLGGFRSIELWHDYMNPVFYNEIMEKGNNPLYRPFPIIDYSADPATGIIDCYEILVGYNVSVFVLGDTARPSNPNRTASDGDPGGVIQPSTYHWLKSKMFGYKDTPRLVFVFSHYGIFETNVATGHYEGGKLQNGVYTGEYHGAGIHNGKYSSHLAYVGDSDAEKPFVQFFTDNPGVCQTWFNGHSHVMMGKSVGDKGHIEEKWVASLSISGR